MVVGETKKKESHDFFWQRESRNFKSDTVKKTSARLPSEGLAIIKNKKNLRRGATGKNIVHPLDRFHWNWKIEFLKLDLKRHIVVEARGVRDIFEFFPCIM